MPPLPIFFIISPIWRCILSSLFNSNYPYMPKDWKVEGGPSNQHEIAARNCFWTAVIYGGFLGLSLMCCVNNKARGRRL